MSKYIAKYVSKQTNNQSTKQTTDQLTDRPTDRPSKQASKQASKQTSKQKSKQASKQNKPIRKQANKHANHRNTYIDNQPQKQFTWIISTYCQKARNPQNSTRVRVPGRLPPGFLQGPDERGRPCAFDAKCIGFVMLCHEHPWTVIKQEPLRSRCLD